METTCLVVQSMRKQIPAMALLACLLHVFLLQLCNKVPQARIQLWGHARHVLSHGWKHGIAG